MLSPLAEIVKHKTTKCIQLANDTVSRKQMVLSAFADAHSDSGLPDVLKTHVHASGLNVFIPLHLKRKVLKREIHWKKPRDRKAGNDKFCLCVINLKVLTA